MLVSSWKVGDIFSLFLTLLNNLKKLGSLSQKAIKTQEAAPLHSHL